MKFALELVLNNPQSVARDGLATLPIPFAGDIERVDLIAYGDAAAEDTIFDVRVGANAGAAVSLYASPAVRPRILSGLTAGGGALSAAVAASRFDVAIIDLKAAPSAGTPSPLTVVLTIEDNQAAVASPMTTIGDMIVGGAAGVAARLAAAPASGLVLTTVAGSAPAWADPHYLGAALAVRNMYLGAVGREPTAGESGDGINTLNASAANAIDFKATFVAYGDTIYGLAESTGRGGTDAEFVSDIYRSYLGRTPDATGLADFLALLAAHTRDYTRNTIPGSSEFNEQYLPRVSTIATLHADAASIHGRRISTTAPTDKQGYTYDAGTGLWIPSTLRPANPMTSSGDIIYGGAAGVETRLPKGTNTQVLTLVAGLPAWADPAASGFANPMTTSGDIIYGGAAGVATRLPKGTNTQVLTLVAGLPAWADAATGAVAPFTSTHPDAAPASANALDDEFNAGALDAKWNWANQGSATATLSNSYCNIKDAGITGTNNCKVLYQAISGTFKVRAKCSVVAASSFSQAGICVRDSGGKLINFYLNMDSAILAITSMNSPTASVASLGSVTNWRALLQVYLEIEEDSTTRYFRASATGAEGSFVQIISHGKTTHLTTGYVGIFINAFQSSTIGSFDWFRRLA